LSEAGRAKDLQQTVREVCLWLPGAEEFISHGSPNFRVCGKTFATYAVNHHGDGRVALWLPAPSGAQEHHVDASPAHFFVPPYVGVRGWLGVRLDRGLAWKRVAELVREAYLHVAPRRLRPSVGAVPSIAAPRKRPAPRDIDPFRSRRGKAVLAVLRGVCLGLPETSEGSQFGHPVWKAGTRSFALARYDGAALTACFWVGAAQQSFLTTDPRIRIPPYIGHRGWIALDVSEHCDRSEITALALQSYRHFALKRMLRALESGRQPR
jgi:predicted DNA-binding protein (MmcQ/YjbR family)